MKTYKIRFSHTSSQTAGSLASAKAHVRRVLGVRRLTLADCPDGLYCWRSAADRNRDDTGANAAAVIESPDQQEAHG